LEATIRRCYGHGWASIALFTVLAVNIITLAADLEGGAAALGLLTTLPFQYFIVPFAAVTGALLIWESYSSIENVLKYVLAIFLAYIAAAFLAHPHWASVLRASFVPQFRLTADYLAGALALIGTTLTSSAYIWETIEESEERPTLGQIAMVKFDAGLGMVFAGIIFWFIIVTNGATLGLHHQQVQTAQDAANALAPLAGRFASLFFGVGLLASAVLAVPILAGTSAYVMAQSFGWQSGLSKKYYEARPFYITLVVVLAAACGVTLLGVPPIRLLFWSSIAGGLGTPITLALMMLVARNPRVMKRHRISRAAAVAGWSITAVVTLADVAFLWQTALPALRH
jgi:Mn2+/Fe2+ NRAMP family transporter